MSELLIRGGDVVRSGGRGRADVRIVGGRVAEVGPELPTEGTEEVVDAAGLLVLPGIIDVHTHFDLEAGEMRTRDDFETGSVSAAAGGVTTYMNFAPQQRGESLLSAMERERDKALGSSLVDFGLHLSFGRPGPDWEEELPQVIEAGVTSAKVYTTYKDTIYFTRDWHWLQLMERAGPAGMLVQVHAENDDIVAGRTSELLEAGHRSFRYHGEARPGIAEIEAVSRALTFSRLTGTGVYLVHLSSPESVRMVAAARAEGLPAFAEVCAHHLSLSADMYNTHDASRYVMTPPLRAPERVAEMQELAASGVVDVFGSDHCGYSLDQRGDDRDFTAASPGIPGVETLWPVIYTTLVADGSMPVEAAVERVTERPAELFGLAPRKGRLEPGADADIVLYDTGPRGPLDERDLHSAAGYSPWHGREIQGRVVRTISRGVTAYDDGQPVDRFDHGRFVPCRPFDPGVVRTETGT